MSEETRRADAKLTKEAIDVKKAEARSAEARVKEAKASAKEIKHDMDFLRKKK